MSSQIIHLDNCCTTSPRNWPVNVFTDWAALCTRLKEEGRSEEFSALSRCGLGMKGTFRAQFGWPETQCGRWFCPPCNFRRIARRLKLWRPRIAAAMGGNGACGGLTLTQPMEGSHQERFASLWANSEKVRQMNAWKNPRTGWNQKLGVLAAFEVSAGAFGQINPHLHLAIFGPSSLDVQEFIRWLSLNWLRLIPGSNPEAQYANEVRESAGPWPEWIRYVLKGTMIHPEWPGETLCGILDLFPRGSRHNTAWGRYRLAKNLAAGNRGIDLG